MGQVYAKTFFPQGYSEWIDKTKLQSETLIPGTDIFEKDKMTIEDYNQYVVDPYAREIIKQLQNMYNEQASQIKDDMNEFIKSHPAKDRISSNRIIYDSLVGKVFCDFWMNLIDQPLETINKYYADNVPNVEKTFYLVENQYNLREIFPANETIAAYQYYTC